MENKKRKKELQNSCLYKLKKGTFNRKKNTLTSAASIKASVPNNVGEKCPVIKTDANSKSFNKLQSKETKLANMKEFHGKMTSMRHMNHS